MRHVETIPRIGEGVIKENDQEVDPNYDVL
jgi:hypothetical protein